MGYGHVTKLMHASRNHQSFISESFTNHTHQTKRATEFQRQKLSNKFREILKRKILQNISRIQDYI